MVYQLEVFGQGESEIWSIDFGQSELRIQKGDLGKINLYEGIASSELYALIQKTTSWDYVALCGNYRTFNNIYRITNGNWSIFRPRKSTRLWNPSWIPSRRPDHGPGKIPERREALEGEGLSS